MKHLLTFTLLLAGAANATLVDFSTSGALSCGAAANCRVLANVLLFHAGNSSQPTLTVTYTPNAQSDLNVDSIASTSFGYLNVACLLCGRHSNVTFNLAGALLGITINQGPDPFSQSSVAFSGVFDGGFSLTSGNIGGLAGISFGSLPIQATYSNGNPNVVYQLQQPLPPPVNGYIISATNTTSLQGVVSSDVPEPATLSLIGVGLLSLGVFRRMQC